MIKLRYCKRCGNIFESSTKFGRICNKCLKTVGGIITTNKKSPYCIDRILETEKWKFGQFNKIK